MKPIEIITIIVAVAIVLGVFIAWVVRKAKGKPTGDCAGCPYAKNCKSHGHCGGDVNILEELKKNAENPTDKIISDKGQENDI